MEAQKILGAKAILRKMNDAEEISSETSTCIPEYSSNKIMAMACNYTYPLKELNKRSNFSTSN